mgnify:CR=1 FL=1
MSKSLLAMKCIARSINLKNFFLIVISLVFINSFEKIVYSEVLNNNQTYEIDFEDVLNQNTVQFHEYESSENLFDDFFGLGDPLNESSLNTNFQDLSLQIDSKNVREIYINKLLEMKKRSKKIGKDQLQWSFFNKKI